MTARNSTKMHATQDSRPDDKFQAPSANMDSKTELHDSEPALNSSSVSTSSVTFLRDEGHVSCTPDSSVDQPSLACSNPKKKQKLSSNSSKSTHEKIAAKATSIGNLGTNLVRAKVDKICSKKVVLSESDDEDGD